jgi:hypothetical protein
MRSQLVYPLALERTTAKRNRFRLDFIPRWVRLSIQPLPYFGGERRGREIVSTGSLRMASVVSPLAKNDPPYLATGNEHVARFYRQFFSRVRAQYNVAFGSDSGGHLGGIMPQ